MKMLMKYTALVALALVANAALAQVSAAVKELQRDWAQANYVLQGEKQLAAFDELAARSTALTEQHADDAGVWIWDGIIKSTYAGAKGGIGALSLAKQSRKSLEKALEIDATALDGSAYTSLGTLYFKVPRWPLGFGSDKKAADMLTRALELNPDGIDSNYFYADYLRHTKRFDEARRYLLKAQQAAPRADRPVADAGRQAEIQAALAELDTRVAAATN